MVSLAPPTFFSSSLLSRRSRSRESRRFLRSCLACFFIVIPTAGWVAVTVWLPGRRVVSAVSVIFFYCKISPSSKCKMPLKMKFYFSSR